MMAAALAEHQCWVNAAGALANWTWERLVVRTDVHGVYFSNNGKTSPSTSHAPLTIEMLKRHFATRFTCDIIGIHPSFFEPTEGAPGGGFSQSKVLLTDIDWHSEEAPPEATAKAARAWHDILVELRFRPLLLDSNGHGGYHLLVVLNEPILTVHVQQLGQMLTRDWKERGLPAAPEIYPRQCVTALTGSCPYGNWIRLPGRHHTREHWSKVWDGECWVSGEEAIAEILAVTGDSPQLIPDEARAFASAARRESIPESGSEHFADNGQARGADEQPRRTSGAGTAYPQPGIKVYDDYAARTSWESILEPLEWVKVRSNGERVNWRRPGKDSNWSGTTGHAGIDAFHCFSSNAPPFEKDKTYTKFQVYALLKHGGDWANAAAELEAQGYGTYIDRDGKEKPNPRPKNWAGNKKAGAGNWNWGATNNQADEQPDFSKMSNEDLGIRPMRSYKKKRVEWDLENRIPQHAYTLIAGEGKQGKTSVVTAFTAAYSTGGELIPGLGHLPCGHVFFLSAEDDPERTIRPRLEALGANIDNVDILEASFKLLAKDGKTKLVNLTSLQDLQYWAEVLNRRPDGVAFIIDPLPSYMGKGINDRVNAEVRQVLEPFAKLLTDHRRTLIGITHLGKSIDGRNAIQRVLDSVAYSNLARATHFVSRDPDNPKRRLFMPGPCNYADADTPSIAFTIGLRDIPDDEGGMISVAVPEFDPVTVAANADEVVNRQSRRSTRGPAATEIPKLAKLLLDRLRSERGPMLLGAIADEAGNAGLLGKQVLKNGRAEWTGFTTLYRAVDAVPNLPPPDDGWEIVTPKEDPTLRMVNGKARWEARRAGMPF
jgi:hypothetical protein